MVEWEKIYDFLIEILEKVVEVGQHSYEWLTSDIHIGTFTFKPIYISVGVLFALLALWLKNKIMGDIG